MIHPRVKEYKITSVLCCFVTAELKLAYRTLDFLKFAAKRFVSRRVEDNTQRRETEDL